MEKELTVKQLHRKIHVYVKKWKAKLYLWSWRIEFKILDWISPTENTAHGSNVAAKTWADWRYFKGNIDFSYFQLKDMDDKSIERIVIHEMLHIVVNEMRYEGIEHEERVVSHISSILGNIEGIL